MEMGIILFDLEYCLLIFNKKSALLLEKYCHPSYLRFKI